MYFCECIDADNLPNTPAQETIKLATLDDVERIMQLRSSIDEFPTAHESEKILRQALETNTGRTYYIEKTVQSSHPPLLPLKIHYLQWLLAYVHTRITAEMDLLHSYYKNDSRLYERKPNTLPVL